MTDMNMRPTKFGIGQSVKRVEDIRFVSGRGNYASDAVDKAELKAVFLRSPYGHAKFHINDIEAARAAPGVRAVYVASDFASVGDMPCLAPVANSDGSNTPLALSRDGVG
jgi:carbon-monoxide dehydrogenase large subunit